MAFGFFTQIGAFLLLAAAVLLLVASISAPVVNNIAMLKVELANKDVISFGTFGYCLLGQGQSASFCTRTTIGYDPITLLESYNVAQYGNAAKNTVQALTNVQILHPIACGLAFIAFFASLGTSVLGSLIASVLSFLTWLITLAVTVTDFVAWGIVKDNVGSNTYARFDTGMWCVLAAMIALFFATFLVLFSCCSLRRSNRVATTRDVKGDPALGTTHHRRRFWQRRAV